MSLKLSARQRKVFEQNEHRAWSMARSMAKSLGAYDEYDAAQDALMALARCCKQRKGDEADWPVYSGGMMMRAVIRGYRALFGNPGSKRQQDAVSRVDVSGLAIASSGWTEQQSDDAEELAAALTLLTRDERLIARLYFGYGLPMYEISSALQISQAKISQAIKDMTACVFEEDGHLYRAG